MSSSLMPLTRRGRRLGRHLMLEGCLTVRRRIERPLPDFVIVGAQRSGTTSLFRALENHPMVASNVMGAKGAHYFDTNYHRGLLWYKAHFADRSALQGKASTIGYSLIAGEASPYYLFHPDCPRRMALTIPEARLIVLLRNPIDRAYSHYQHMVWEGHETLPTFEAALEAEPARLAGEEERLLSDPRYRSPAHQHHSYAARGQYAEQIARLLEHYPREQVFVIATETLAANPQTHLPRIQEFLGLKVDPAVVMARRNAGYYSTMAATTRRRLGGTFSVSNEKLLTLTRVDIPWSLGD